MERFTPLVEGQSSTGQPHEPILGECIDFSVHQMTEETHIDDRCY